MPQKQRKQGNERVQLLWGGRFKKPLAEEALRFSSSFSVDKRLWKQGHLGFNCSRCHVGRDRDNQRLRGKSACQGLFALMRDIEAGKVELEGPDEDIHSFVERKLREYVGEVAGKLHTARSRNDQVVTDFRLWCRDAVKQLAEAILKMQKR
jgi:argininosuccinate lyase